MTETEISRTIDTTNPRAAYDENAKELLAEKIILAHILSGSVPEFRNVAPEDIIPLIEGTPQVSEVPVFPGGTINPKVTGLSNEDSTPNEGKVTYDVRFFVWTLDKKSMLKLIVDIEAQKDYYPGYDIVTRGIYYGARMISSQAGTEFGNSDYNNIKKVYSIWICMDTPKYAENTISEYSFVQKNILGNFPLNKTRFDLISVITICLSKNIFDNKENFKLNRLLSVLFTSELDSGEKKKIIETEYNIPMTEDLDRKVSVMCNLSEVIMEEGIEKGIEKGIAKGIKSTILLLRKENYTDMRIKKLIMEQYNLSEDTANEYLCKNED